MKKLISRCNTKSSFNLPKPPFIAKSVVSGIIYLILPNSEWTKSIDDHLYLGCVLFNEDKDVWSVGEILSISKCDLKVVNYPVSIDFDVE